MSDRPIIWPSRDSARSKQCANRQGANHRDRSDDGDIIAPDLRGGRVAARDYATRIIPFGRARNFTGVMSDHRFHTFHISHYARNFNVAAGQTISVAAPNVVVGENEFYVRSTVADDDPDKIRAVRVRILRNGEVIAKQWVESEPGMAVEGPVMIEVPASAAPHVEDE